MHWRIAQMGLLILGLCSLALVVGCGGGGGGGGPSDTADSLTDEGWDLFEQGNYAGAIGKFNGAVALDVMYAEAYEGLGWSYAKLDSLPRALANLELCIARGMTTADPYAGKAPVLRDMDPPQYANAITAAGTALSKSATYEFAHYEEFDYRDLHMIRAQCYYALNQFTQAKAEVDALGGTALDPNSPTFEKDLAAEIERLGSLYGS